MSPFLHRAYDAEEVIFIRYVYISLGFISVGLAYAGLLLPLLPGAPFVVLASFFFTKGSPRFEKWLFGTTLYKKYVLDFMETRSVSPAVKAALLVFATVLLAIPFFLTQKLWLRIALACALAMEYAFFIFAVKTKKK